MAAIMLDLRTKNDSKYCGDDVDRRFKSVTAFYNVVFEHQTQVLRATKYQSVAKRGVSGLADEEVKVTLKLMCFFWVKISLVIMRRDED